MSDDGGHSTADSGFEGTVTWRELYRETVARLGGNARHARWICEDVSGNDGQDWHRGLGEPATERAVATLDAMVARVIDGEPLQYVLGHWGFRRLDLLVDRRVLIPRPETELLVEMAIELLADLPRPWQIADLGTGSGAIALALADELPLGSATVWATDVSADALDVARANLAGLGRRATSVRLDLGSWWTALPAGEAGSFDMVLSNPPYIADDDPRVEPIVRAWEPGEALFASSDGLAALAEIVGGAPTWLRPGGWLLCEIGSGQGSAATDLAIAAGLIGARIHQDLAGHDRILSARRPGG